MSHGKRSQARSRDKQPRRKLEDRPMDDPSRAPEEEGSATRTGNKRELLDQNKTDESGAPVD